MAMMEFSDARDAFLRVLLFSAVALIASAFAILSLSAMIVAVAWDALGWRILFILFLGYVVLAIGMLWTARSIIASGQIGLPVTLAELKKDRAALFDEHGQTDRSA